MDALLEKLHDTTSDRAQQQLDSLRDALVVRLSALETAIADPARGEALEGLIVELARVATEEAQAAALTVCLDTKLEADAGVAHARAVAQEAIDHERAANAELHRVVEQGRQAIANLEQEQLARARTLREDLEGEIARERADAAGAVLDAERQLQAERTVSADLRAAMERAAAATEQQLQAERAAGADLRLAVERAQTLSATLEREKAQAWTAQEALTANLVRERETAAALQRDNVKTQSLLDAERGVSADLRRAIAHAEQELTNAASNQARISASQSELQQELAAARAEADAVRRDLVAAGSRLEMLDAERLRAEHTRKDAEEARMDADHARQGLDAQLESLARERDSLASDLQAARQLLKSSEQPRPVASTPAAPGSMADSHAGVVGTIGSDASSPQTEPAPSPGLAAAPSATLSPQASSADGWGPVRLAVRHVFHEPIEVQINGDVGTLVDLSACGCQLVSSSAVKPNQVVKVLLPGAEAPIACTGKVMWARFEPRAAGRSLGYRAGVQFTKPDQAAIEAFVAARALNR